jgi:hypothetical protein
MLRVHWTAVVAAVRRFRHVVAVAVSVLRNWCSEAEGHGALLSTLRLSLLVHNVVVRPTVKRPSVCVAPLLLTMAVAAVRVAVPVAVARAVADVQRSTLLRSEVAVDDALSRFVVASAHDAVVVVVRADELQTSSQVAVEKAPMICERLRLRRLLLQQLLVDVFE